MKIVLTNAQVAFTFSSIGRKRWNIIYEKDDIRDRSGADPGRGTGWVWNEKKESSDEDIDTGFRMLEKFNSTSSYVAYDKTTGVMYFFNFEGGVTPIFNADGTLRIWEG